MTNDENIKSLGDLIGSSNQIALVNIGSIQHILLAKALSENGFDAHALDANIVAMKHPDGMTALQTGAVSCHLTSSPYIFTEREQDDLTELTEVSETWTSEDSFIVGVASEKLHDENPDLYAALCAGISAAIDFVNASPEDTAALTCEYDGNSAEDELEYLGLGTYSAATSGVLELAQFMGENGFIDAAPASIDELVFDGVEGD
jgi:NitT/TauT family transport system substrate-binding protein